MSGVGVAQISRTKAIWSDAVRILFAYERDPTNEFAQSGRPYQLRKALLQAGHDVFDCGGLFKRVPEPRLPLKKITARLLGLKDGTDRDPRRLCRVAKIVEEQFVADRCDLIISPSTLPVAMLAEEYPYVVIVDCFYQYMRGRYRQFDRVSFVYRRVAQATDLLALKKARRSVFPTNDVRRAAIGAGIPPDRIGVEPWGSNLAGLNAISSEELEARRRSKTLLFVGREWKRKGFDVLCETLRAPRARDLRCVVLGLSRSSVPRQVWRGLEGRLDFLGELRLSKEDERSRVLEAYRRSAALIAPVRAENFGITYVDALNFYLPIFTSNVDGIPETFGTSTAVSYFDRQGAAKEYADKIVQLFSDPSAYADACHASKDLARKFGWGRVIDAALGKS